MNSIVSFSIKVFDGLSFQYGRFLDFDECKHFHYLMTQPLIKYLRGRYTEIMSLFNKSDQKVLQKVDSVKALLGQPVKLADDGHSILRIALGADMVVNHLSEYFLNSDGSRSNCISPDRLFIQALVNKALVSDNLLLEKAALIAQHWTVFYPSGRSSVLNNLGSVSLRERMIRYDDELAYKNPDSLIRRQQQKSCTDATLISKIMKQIMSDIQLPKGHTKSYI